MRYSLRRALSYKAITATAHKLARIVYHLLSTREAYNESVFHRCDETALKRAQFRLLLHVLNSEKRLGSSVAVFTRFRS